MIGVKGQGTKSEGQGDLQIGFDFVPLIKDVMRSQKVKQTELERETGIKQWTLSRYLSHGSDMDLAAFHLIASALKIDQFRAYVAVCVLHDWRMYHDERIIAISTLQAKILEESLKLGGLEELPAAEIERVAKQSVVSLRERKMKVDHLPEHPTRQIAHA